MSSEKMKNNGTLKVSTEDTENSGIPEKIDMISIENEKNTKLGNQDTTPDAEITAGTGKPCEKEITAGTGKPCEKDAVGAAEDGMGDGPGPEGEVGEVGGVWAGNKAVTNGTAALLTATPGKRETAEVSALTFFFNYYLPKIIAY